MKDEQLKLTRRFLRLATVVAKCRQGDESGGDRCRLCVKGDLVAVVMFGNSTGDGHESLLWWVIENVVEGLVAVHKRGIVEGRDTVDNPVVVDEALLSVGACNISTEDSLVGSANVSTSGSEGSIGRHSTYGSV